MKVADYEKTYKSVNNAIESTQYLDDVVEFLRKQNEPVTCATIGEAIFGNQYNHPRLSSSCRSKMGQMLRHLRHGGFIKMEERKGNPIEVEVNSWIPEIDIHGEPSHITVHDDKGRDYNILNPHYTGNWVKRGHVGKIKKTITPTIKFYTWIA